MRRRGPHGIPASPGRPVPSRGRCARQRRSGSHGLRKARLLDHRPWCPHPVPRRRHPRGHGRRYAVDTTVARHARRLPHLRRRLAPHRSRAGVLPRGRCASHDPRRPRHRAPVAIRLPRVRVEGTRCRRAGHPRRRVRALLLLPRGALRGATRHLVGRPRRRWPCARRRPRRVGDRTVGRLRPPARHDRQWCQTGTTSSGARPATAANTCPIASRRCGTSRRRRQSRTANRPTNGLGDTRRPPGGGRATRRG